MEIDVSIIIPAYNVGKYLDKCLQSIAAQTLKSKEVLCVDDGSTDDTWEKLQAYQKRYDWIKIWKQKNAGSGPARNFALEKATGRYVAFMDADDWYMDPTSLEVLVREADAHQCLAAAGLRKIFKPEGCFDSPMFRSLSLSTGESVVVQYRDYQIDTDYQQYIISRRMLRENNIRFPALRRGQDMPFLFQALVEAKTICVCPVEFYAYRWGHQAITSNWGKINLILEAHRRNMELAKKENYRILQQRTIERINIMYNDRIRENFNIGTLKKLLEIDDERIIDTPINIIQECIQGGKGELKFLHQFIFLLQSNVDFSILFRALNIRSIAIYGLGNFGEMFYQTVQNSDIEILKCIDNYKRGTWHNLSVINKKEIPSDEIIADAIVVCMVSDRGVLNELRETRKEIIISFRELVNKINDLVTVCD